MPAHKAGAGGVSQVELELPRRIKLELSDGQSGAMSPLGPAANAPMKQNRHQRLAGSVARDARQSC